VERPHTTPPFKAISFEEVLNNFKASYFAVALLMNKEQVIDDLHELFDRKKWNDKFILDLMNKYSASPEMFLHRLTNLLPTFFGIKNLFFLRFSHSGKTQLFQLTKELHLSKLHNPHGNELNEHYCRRWISLRLIKELHKQKKNGSRDPIAGVQRSKYWESKNEYLCISLAKANTPTPNSNVSVTVGFLIDENLKKKIQFLNDDKIIAKTVNETCERCPIEDCKERVAEPTVIKSDQKVETIETALAGLS